MKETKDNSGSYYDHEGKKVPRVSNIIKLMDKPGIAQWANSLGFRRISLKNTLDRASNIGTMTHALIESMYDKKIFDTLPSVYFMDFGAYGVYDWDDRQRVKNAYMSYLKWRLDTDRKFHPVRYSELTLTCDEYGGTIDCVEECSLSRVILTDYKTSSDFHATMFMQLAAYIYLYETNFPPQQVAGCRVILLDKKHGETAKDLYIPREDMFHFVSAFRSLLKLYQTMEVIDENKSWKKRLQDNRSDI